MPDANTLIDLAAPRVVSINDRGHDYVYTLAPIGPSQWKRYFDGIISTAERIDKDTVSSYDNSAASAELVRSALTSVQGYKIAGDEPLDALPNWKTMLPHGHLLAVASTLREIERVETDEPITLGADVVTLSAIWGHAGEKKMTRCPRLVHRFRPPTIDHQRRYSRDSSRSIMVGGSRTGKTKWLGVQNTLAGIYDELIESVDGYHIGYAALRDADLIKAHMDTYHKVAAAEALFAPATVTEQEGEDA